MRRSSVTKAQSQGLDSFHATIVLNLSWMNNTNTFIPVESGALRVVSLSVYGADLLPYFNLILPVALVFGPYFTYLLHKTPKPAAVEETPETTAVDEARTDDTAWGVRIGLLVLFVINVFFILDTELSIARNESRQDNQDGVWTFGQTLALILLLLLLRDAAENILQRSEKRVQWRLLLNEAVNNLRLYRDQVPWKTVERWVKIIGDTPVDAHQLWLRRASAQNKIDIVRFLLRNGADVKDQVYPRQVDVSHG
ncbi:hypothetical protein B0H19DRAFT_1146164 [Mycena capillaripes]|nr:hypothetical protein B0H19DRAFT_1146164 [Mycena capillaripes]